MRCHLTFRRQLWCIVATVLCFTGCASKAHPTHVSLLAQVPSVVKVPNLYDVRPQLDQDISSRQYLAETKAYLGERAEAEGRLVIILDIDETFLSNWLAYKANGQARILSEDCGLEHGPCGLRSWQTMVKAGAITPTFELVELARQRNIAVDFIGGRTEFFREATEKLA